MVEFFEGRYSEAAVLYERGREIAGEIVWLDGFVGRAYAKAIPKARFKLIEKAGHLPHIERPAVFMREVRRFLAA